MPDQPHSGAILNTTFTVTANPAKDQNDECAAVSDETEVNDKDTTIGDAASNDDTVGVTLTVVQQPLSDGSGGAECDYNVSADLPGGFVATTPGKPGSESESVKSYGLTPDMKFVADNGTEEQGGRDDDIAPDEIDTSVADCGATVITDVGLDELLTGDDNTTATVGGRPVHQPRGVREPGGHLHPAGRPRRRR